MQTNNILIDNAKLAFKNFSGEEGKFNAAGLRNFCVFLDKDIAEKLELDDWNIRWLDPKDDGEERQAYMKVSVGYNAMPPKIVLVSSRGKTALGEAEISMLDWVEMEKVDLLIRPYNWEVNGKKGIKAYVKSMFVTIVEDELEKRYYDVPDSAADAIGGCGNCEVCDGNCKHGR